MSEAGHDIRAQFLADLREVMRARGVSQSDIARRLCVPRAVVSRALSGKANITTDTMGKLAEAAGALVVVQVRKANP